MPYFQTNKKWGLFSLLLVSFPASVYFFAGCMSAGQPLKLNDRSLSFDSDWRFTRDSVAGAEQPGFDDSRWRLLDLPHDWSIEDLPEQVPGKTIGPFSKDSNDLMKGRSTAHTIGGTGWYRKTFTLDTDNQNKLLSIYFEGVYMETDVWINGNYLGSHKHGYTSFFFDITRFCKPPGQKNVLAVRVINKGQNSRWYSGSGIYRHVKLIVTNPLHIEPWGVYVTTPRVSTAEASVKLVTTIFNEKSEKQDIKIRIRVLDEDHKTVAESEVSSSLNAHDKSGITRDITIPSPKLWSPDSPYLYQAETAVWANGKTEDITTTDFGIRSLSFDAINGFVLNGKKMELRGGCMHHDNGLLGSAAIDRAEQRKVELLKSYGFNAVRSSHYPPSEKFLESCDRLGLLVIDEAFDMWQRPKNPEDYHLYFDDYWKRDLSSMVMRDRNHPSVMLWSLGNEIEERADLSGLPIIKKLKTLINELDPSRLTTMAVCEFWDHPGKIPWSATAPTFALLDVGGYNYQWWQYEPDHEKFPQRIMVGTESVPMHAFQNWQMVEKHPYVIGDFVWTAMDYLGESGIGHASCEIQKDDQLMPWPWFNAYCGDIDLIGNKKPQSYYRDVVWRRSKIEMAVHSPLPEGCKEKVSYWGWPDEQQNWTWPGQEGKKMEVIVYSRYKAVRLKLNEKIIGEKTIVDSNMLTAKFDLVYQPGELKAVGIENGMETGSVILSTAGQAKSLRLKVDRPAIRADRNDLAYITVEVVDEKNNIVPDANIPVEFSVSGAGEIAGVGNADPADMASFQKPMRNTFRGRCLVILRPNGPAGEIVLEVKAKGLAAAKTVVITK